MSLLGNHLLLKAHDMTTNFCAIHQTVAVTTKTITVSQWKWRECQGMTKVMKYGSSEDH